ncbi:DUF5302 domain-containing protein [Rhodococcus sp. 14C212]|uniref:DUF5302 domain-containing protein n=1 Tax=Rhodococcus sp. 14C212 TaxID=2711209 RepID=UPI0013EBA483|nr:DUF5302 domain-containing protein [Rhodococcus sp. 14C212]NGP06925.1 DUF5302 domain-containing protein [Rhodococcus sp. 14C212]
MNDPNGERIAEQFRAALERKNQHARRGTDHLDGRAKAQAPHGSADHRRNFRRKSG